MLVPEENGEVSHRYEDHYYAGKPAIVRHAYGKGRCYTVGTMMEPAGLQGFLRHGVLPRAGVATLPDPPESVEVSYRSKARQRYAFYLNHAATPVSVALAKPGRELLTQRAVGGEVLIPGFGVLVVKETI